MAGKRIHATERNRRERVGKALRVRMAELGLSTQEVSKYLLEYTSYWRVARIVRGEARATKKEQAILSRVLLTSQKELFGEEEC